LSADILKIQKKRNKKSTLVRNVTKSNIAKLFQTLYLDQYVCLTQLSTLVDTPLGATPDVEYC
jgi:hypothetical protein